MAYAMCQALSKSFKNTNSATFHKSPIWYVPVTFHSTDEEVERGKVTYSRLLN